MALVQALAKQSYSGATGVGGLTVTAAGNFTAGNAVFLLTQFFPSSNTNLLAASVGGNAMTRLIGAQLGTSCQGEIWWIASNPGGVATVVVDFDAGGHDGFASLLEWSGVTGIDAGTANSNLQAASLAPTVSTLGSTSQANTLSLAVCASGATSNPNTFTQPGGLWTALGTETNGATNNSGATCYMVDPGAAGVKTATWAQTTSALTRNSIISMTLSGGGGGGGGGGQQNRLLTGAG